MSFPSINKAPKWHICAILMGIYIPLFIHDGELKKVFEEIPWSMISQVSGYSEAMTYNA